MPSRKQGSKEEYHFTLYIDSEMPKCFHVADKLQQLCRQYLPDFHSVEVIDLREDLSLFERLRIIAVPTLIVSTPQSKTHRFVGDLSQTEVFIVALGMAQEANKMGQEAGKMGRTALEMRERLKPP